MNSIVYILFIIAAGLLSFGAMKLFASQLAGKKWYLVPLYVAGWALAVIVVLMVLAPLSGFLIGVISKTSGIHPIVPALIFAGVVAYACFYGVKPWLLAIMKKSLPGGQPEDGLLKISEKVITFFLFFFCVYFTLDILGIAYGQNLRWWSWYVALASVAILSGYRFFFRNWAKENQEKWAVMMGYSLDVCLSIYILYYFGYNALADLRGSLEISSVFLLFNFLLFFFSFGLGKEKEMKKKVSYWLVWMWTFLLILVFGGIVYLQATHQITRQERLSARMLNIVRWQKEDVDRSIALYGLEAAAKAAEEAYKAGDSDSLSQLEKEITKIEANVRKVPRAKYVAPEAVGKTITKIKGLPGDVLEIVSSSSRVSRQVVFEKSYEMKDAYDEYGQVRTFQAGKDDVKKGDKLEIIAKPKNGGEFSGTEIYIWRGGEFDPKWARTVNGYYSREIEQLDDGGFFVISLAKRDDISVTVRVTRISNS